MASARRNEKSQVQFPKSNLSFQEMFKSITFWALDNLFPLKGKSLVPALLSGCAIKHTYRNDRRSRNNFSFRVCDMCHSVNLKLLFCKFCLIFQKALKMMYLYKWIFCMSNHTCGSSQGFDMEKPGEQFVCAFVLHFCKIIVKEVFFIRA